MSPHSLVKPLPHRFTIALHATLRLISNLRFEIKRSVGGWAVCSLLHYSVGFPRLAVSQPAVLWCSDFPPARDARERSPGPLLQLPANIIACACRVQDLPSHLPLPDYQPSARAAAESDHPTGFAFDRFAPLHPQHPFAIEGDISLLYSPICALHLYLR
jgi:hypothetical protein